MTGLLDRYGVVDLPALQAKIVAALTQRSESLAGRASTSAARRST
jgi:hypothetical protein